jgi:hypothetical protein
MTGGSVDNFMASGGPRPPNAHTCCCSNPPPNTHTWCCSKLSAPQECEASPGAKRGMRARTNVDVGCGSACAAGLRALGVGSCLTLPGHLGLQA